MLFKMFEARVLVILVRMLVAYAGNFRVVMQFIFREGMEVRVKGVGGIVIL